MPIPSAARADAIPTSARFGSVTALPISIGSVIEASGRVRLTAGGPEPAGAVEPDDDGPPEADGPPDEGACPEQATVRAQTIPTSRRWRCITSPRSARRGRGVIVDLRHFRGTRPGYDSRDGWRPGARHQPRSPR